MVLTAAAQDILWHYWDDVYIVYQPSSAETHVFNETTALILKCLECGPLSADEVKEQAEAALGVAPDKLPKEDFAFATSRLEELGLIDCLDAASSVQ